MTVSGYTISGNDAANYNLLQPTGLSAKISTLGVSPTGLAVNNKTYDAKLTATLLNGSVVGLLGDMVSLNNVAATATFADSAVGTGKTVTITGLSLSGTDAYNYFLDSISYTVLADITANVAPPASVLTFILNPKAGTNTTTSSSGGSGAGGTSSSGGSGSGVGSTTEITTAKDVAALLSAKTTVPTTFTVLSTDIVLPEDTEDSPQILNRSTTKYNTGIEDAYQRNSYFYIYPRVNLGSAYYVGAPSADTTSQPVQR